MQKVLHNINHTVAKVCNVFPLYSAWHAATFISECDYTMSSTIDGSWNAQNVFFCPCMYVGVVSVL